MSRLVALTLTALLALTVASCGGGGESSSSEPASAATTEAVVTEPAVTESAVTEAVVTEPATTDAPASTEPAISEPDEALVEGAEVDDDPVCQALRRVYAAAFFYALGGGFGADDGAVEKVELFLAPALAPDVVVVRTQGPAEFGVFPTLDRIEAGNGALAAGGFTDEELVALAASGNDAIDGVLAGTGLDGLDDVGTAAGAETKLAAAAEAFLAEVGTFAEYLDALEANVDPAAEAAFTEKLATLCPILAATLESQ